MYATIPRSRRLLKWLGARTPVLLHALLPGSLALVVKLNEDLVPGWQWFRCRIDWADYVSINIDHIVFRAQSFCR